MASITGTQEGETTMSNDYLLGEINNEEDDDHDEALTALWEMWFETVEQNCWALKYVPKALRGKVRRALKSGK